MIQTDKPSIYTTYEKMKEIFYEASDDDVREFYDTLNEYAVPFNVTSLVHENFFMAQIIAETGYDLKPKRENLNYSCEALRSTFKIYKDNPGWSKRDGRCEGHPAFPERIANVAYANRLGNGDIASGDGYKFRGGGYFQLTGRGNYRDIAEHIQKYTGSALDEENIVDYIDTVYMSTVTALAFWDKNKCYKCSTIDCVTKKINKYTDSYDKRKKIYQWIASLGE